MARKSKEEIGPLTVSFKAGLRTDGGIIRVSLTQFEAHVDLTAEQAISLARTIRARLGD